MPAYRNNPRDANVLMIDEDSDSIRIIFRRLCQRGAVLIGLGALLYGSVMFVLDISDWYLHLGMAAVCAPLYWLLSVRRSYPVFLASLVTMVVLLCVICSYSTMQFGRDAGFQLILIALVPVIVVSGRINARVKWLLVAMFTLYLIWLESRAVTSNYDGVLPPIAMTLMRSMNYLVLIFATTGLVFHYFRLAARQYTALMDMAMIDPLTGLYNRRQMGVHAQQAIVDCRSSNQPLSVILCDLDHFKAINDTLGHDAGDAVLRRVGRELSVGVRAVDSVGRWGGEEFLLLLPQTDLEGAITLAERLRARIADPANARNPSEPHVTATMGVATLRPADNLESAISRADTALYAGKAGGRNRVIVEAA